MYIFPASYGIYGLFHARGIYSLLGKEYVKSLAIVKNTVVYIPCYARNIWKLHVKYSFPDSNCQYTALNFLTNIKNLSVYISTVELPQHNSLQATRPMPMD